MSKRRVIRPAALALAGWASVAPLRAQTVDADAYLRVRKPGGITWSPDGTRLAAFLTDARDGELRVYDVPTGAMTRVVTGLPRPRRYQDRGEIRWSADGSTLIYRHGPQYWRVAATGGTPTPLLRDTLPREIVVLSPTGDRLSFVRGGDLWVQPFPDGVPRKLVTGEKFLAGPAEFYGRFTEWTPWSPDGRQLTFLAQTPDSGLRLGVARVSDGRIRWLPAGGAIWDYYSVQWAPRGDRLTVARLSRDFRRKQLSLWEIDSDRARVLWEDTDPQWVDHNILPSFAADWAPDGTRIAFISNRDGWRRVRILDLASGATREVTPAGTEAGTVWWSPDGAHLLVAGNQHSRHSVRLWSFPATGGDGTLLTPGEGVLDGAAARGSRPEAEWSPDGRSVAYVMSRPGEPFEIGVALVGTGREPTVLYSATAESLPLDAQAAIRPVQFTARDGTPIPGVLLEPRRAEPGVRRPALVYHYGGWNQEARLGWHLGIKSRLFEYLVSRGWVVLIADVRGSDGYGRAHAHGLYHEGGGLQATDLADAAGWLRTQPFVGSDRIAIFGHSYGAYLALTTMLREPAAFQAGVLMAGVFDWGGLAAGAYVGIRFGDPKSLAVPDLQYRPARHVSGLAAPVLVYHGTGDFNAPIFFSHQLVRELMRARRDYEYAVYPDEPHDWDREETDRDFLVRTERFLASRMPGRPGNQDASAELDRMVREYSTRLRDEQAALPELSFDKVRRDADSARAWLGRLDRIPEAGLSHQERLTRELLKWETWKALQDTTLYWYTFPLLPAISPFRGFLPRIQAQPLGTAAERERYLALLERAATLLGALREKTLTQQARGVVLPREQIDNVLPYLRGLGAPPATSPFMPAAERLAAVPEAERTAFAAQVRATIERRIVPAGRSLVRYVGRELRRAAPTAVGLWQYPGGKEAYRTLVRRETTLDIGPEEIHALALRQMDELEARMKRIRDSLGFSGTKEQFHEQLRRDPRFYVSVPDAVGARLMGYADRLEPVLDRAFSRRPKSPYGVRRLDPALEPSMTYGYYSFATGADPKGYYFFNGSDLDQRSLLMAGAIAFHELIPGHHFQINLQRENDSLPAFRRSVLHAGFTEGWGEYSSSIVAAELGMYRDAYEIYGRLVFDAFFIARLVVDTGMNFYGWPRERAMAYMREHTLESDVQINSETLRYSTRQPAQALAYRMGRETFVSLRARAERELGAGFDLRRFHDALLMSGTMPLWLLERHVDHWIAGEKARRGQA